MAKCVRCRQRKAKRPCPALGGDLCPLCCGKHRNRDIPCPANCAFLVQHSPYQQQRSQEKEEEDFFQDERLVWLAYNIEIPLRVLAERYSTFSDEEAVGALEYARDKLARSRSLVVLPGEVLRPGNEAGEAIFESMEKCRFEGRIILPGHRTGYGQEEKLKVLDRMLQAARTSLKGSPDGRAFLEQLLARHRRAGETSRP